LELVRHAIERRPVDKLGEYYRWLLCVLVATVPVEGIMYPVFKYLGIHEYRSPSFFIGILATGLSVVFIPQIYQVLKKSYFIMFMLAANLVALGVHYFQIWAPNLPSIRFLSFKMMLMGILLLLLVEKPVWRRRMVNAYLIGWVIFVCLSVYYMLTNQVVLMKYHNVLRAKSLLLLDANIHALTTMTGMLICFNRLLAEKATKWQIIYMVLWIIGLSSIFFGASRTGTIILVFGTVVTTIYHLWFNRRQSGFSKRFKVLLASVVLVVVGTFLVVNMDLTRPYVLSVGSRFSNTLDKGDYGQRYALSMATLEVAYNNPTGIGLGNSMAYLRGHDPHNDYFRMFAEGGLFSGLLMIVGLGFLIKNWYLWRKSNTHVGPFIILLTLLVANFTIQGFNKQFFWVFFALYAVPPPKGYFSQEKKQQMDAQLSRMTAEQRSEMLVKNNSQSKYAL